MIRNLRAVSTDYVTAGQPTERELEELAEGGLRAVINLGLSDTKYCLPDEAGSAASLGLEYTHVPVRFDEPREEDFRRFVHALDEAPRPVLRAVLLSRASVGSRDLWLRCRPRYP